MPVALGMIIHEQCHATGCKNAGVLASRAVRRRQADPTNGEDPKWAYWEHVGDWCFWCTDHQHLMLMHSTALTVLEKVLSDGVS